MSMSNQLNPVTRLKTMVLAVNGFRKNLARGFICSINIFVRLSFSEISDFTVVARRVLGLVGFELWHFPLFGVRVAYSGLLYCLGWCLGTFGVTVPRKSPVFVDRLPALRVGQNGLRGAANCQ